VAAAGPAPGKLFQLGVAGGKVDLGGDQLIAALPVLAGETAALEAQNIARARPLGDSEHDGTLGRRDLHLRPKHRLLERNREGQPDVVALAGEEAMRLDLDRDEGVAASTRTVLTLARKPDA